ncbi:MAG: ATP synthase F1 subunit delta [Saprospiraceae bacterium]|jgi:F-type H+-transporting ATPase subunit delta|nr:ATP synthase F1 subunit delta [Saprospiraceae bacterium]MBL0023790.1 ATP synthase F1 subunit delta [Saprospiraceae bacterium]
MSVSRISSRYAKSLMDLALERNELEAVKKDITFFNEAVKNRDLYLLLKSPIIKADKKVSIFKIIFGGKVGKTTMAFFDIIIRKGRETYLREIAVDFMRQYRDFNSISSVIISTASPLSESSLNEIKSKLLSSSITLDKVEITEKVDPALIGGFVIEVGDRLYDASISHKLDELRKEFIENQFVKSF